MNLGFNSMLYEGLRGRKIKTSAIFSRFLGKPKKQQILLIMTNTFKSDLGCSAFEPFLLPRVPRW